MSVWLVLIWPLIWAVKKLIEADDRARARAERDMRHGTPTKNDQQGADSVRRTSSMTSLSCVKCHKKVGVLCTTINNIGVSYWDGTQYTYTPPGPSREMTDDEIAAQRRDTYCDECARIKAWVSEIAAAMKEPPQ